MAESKTVKADAPVKHETLAAALAAFQAEVPTVIKGATAEVQTKAGGTYKYQYAGLETITPLVLPLLGKNGLSWSTQPTLMGEDFILHYELKHELGECIEGIYPLPDPSVGKPQDLGSAITYARRYALCAVTGVAPGGDDDDAQAANDKPAASRSRKARPATPIPAPVPEPVVASQDWAAQILDVDTIDDLKTVYVAAEKALELGNRLSPDHGKALDAVVEHFGLQAPPETVTVGQLVNAVKGALQSRPEPDTELGVEAPADAAADGGSVKSWPTATPGGEQA